MTVVSHFPEANQTDNYRDVSVKGTTQTLLEVVTFANFTGARYEKYTGGLLIDYFASFTCPAAMKSEAVRQLVKSQEQYDVILIEMFNSHCFAGFIEKFQAPFIGLSSHVLMPWTNDWFGNPDNPSYIPNIFMDFSAEMSFRERVENTVMQVFTKLYYRYSVTPDAAEISRKHLGLDISDDIMYNASAIIVNSHYTLHGPRPFVPGVVEAGGMHVGKVKPLPEVCLQKVTCLYGCLDND